MSYEKPKKRYKENDYHFTDDLFFIVVKKKEYVFDKQDSEILLKYYWNTRTKINYLYTANKYDTSIAAHRLILGIKKGDKRIVDHINRDVLDNRRSNLRITDKSGNMMNISKPQGKNPFRGVSWQKNRKTWNVTISYKKNGKRIHVHGGVYRDAEEARIRRIELEKIYFKDFSPN